MKLKTITLVGFKSFAKKTTLDVTHKVTGVVGPNGSGKSNIAEAIRFVLGEQSMKSMRGKTGSDVIFKGSEHLPPLARASVSMSIDNTEKIDTTHISEGLAPYLVYDELVLSRVIYADGTSDYMLNDAKIRLKDVQELLSFAGIGGSAHTIINQGEADRILLASPRDKKEALEDALGLRVYHIRLNESRKKLEKVESHLREVDLLRKEVKPHLLHLERLVKKIHDGDAERKVLEAMLFAYLSKEEKEIFFLEEGVKNEGTSLSLETISQSLQKELATLSNKKHSTQDVVDSERDSLEVELRTLYTRKEYLSKTVGRLEGELSYLKGELKRTEEKQDVVIDSGLFADTHATFTYALESLERALVGSDLPKAIREEKVLSIAVEDFFSSCLNGASIKERRDSLTEKIQTTEKLIEEHKQKEEAVLIEITGIRQKIDALVSLSQTAVTSRHEEKIKVLQLESKLRELSSVIHLRKKEEEVIETRKRYFDVLLNESVMMLGRVVLDYRNQTPLEKYSRMESRELLRLIERSRLRIEEANIPNRIEILQEYKTTKEREEYLEKEMADIEESKKKLLILIDELSKTLGEKFTSGVSHVSQVFSDFFAEIFPSGKAKITLLTLKKINDEGEEEVEQGIDIDVSLPNKRVKELAMFSGGERTLVSIALLFAMSSITPPPFMVLDETDAPLDESNARKYGLMLKRLATKSNLLVITHNRETMNHCDMLYGVTLGIDGGSKLLSVSFKEAEVMAVPVV